MTMAPIKWCCKEESDNRQREKKKRGKMLSIHPFLRRRTILVFVPASALMHLRAREFTRLLLQIPLSLSHSLSFHESNSTSQYRMRFRSRLSRFAIPFVSAVFFKPYSRVPSRFLLLLPSGCHCAFIRTGNVSRGGWRAFRMHSPYANRAERQGSQKAADCLFRLTRIATYIEIYKIFV